MSDPFFSISIVFTVKIKPRPPQVQQKKKQLANSSFRSIEVLFYIYRKEEFYTIAKSMRDTGVWILYILFIA